MEYVKGRSLAALAALVVVLFLSCAGSPDAYGPIDAGVESGSYGHALASINDEGSDARKSVYTSKNEILLYLDRGMISHYAGEYRLSSEDLQIAEQMIEEAYTKSISQSVTSYIVNDNSIEYAGEDYEDLYINVFNSLNYYHNGNIESALVEIRRLNEKLAYFADKYEKAKEKVGESDGAGKADLGGVQMEASSFSNSALARYLGILFFRGTGRTDDARIDYEELKRAFSLAPGIYTNSIPSSLEEELSVPSGEGRLNVIAFTGLSPVKQEQSIIIPLPFDFPNNTAKLALPIMIDRPQLADRVEVVLDNGETFPLELLEDMGAVAKETFKSRYVVTVLKTVVRSVLKVSASAAVTSIAEENQGGAFGLLVGAVGRIAAGASESADTRISRYFPRYALVGGINLKPGDYGVTVNYYGGGRLLNSESKEITVKTDAVNLAEFVYLK